MGPEVGPTAPRCGPLQARNGGVGAAGSAALWPRQVPDFRASCV